MTLATQTKVFQRTTSSRLWIQRRYWKSVRPSWPSPIISEAQHVLHPPAYLSGHTPPSTHLLPSTMNASPPRPRHPDLIVINLSPTQQAQSDPLMLVLMEQCNARQVARGLESGGDLASQSRAKDPAAAGSPVHITRKVDADCLIVDTPAAAASAHAQPGASSQPSASAPSKPVSWLNSSAPSEYWNTSLLRNMLADSSGVRFPICSCKLISDHLTPFPSRFQSTLSRGSQHQSLWQRPAQSQRSPSPPPSAQPQPLYQHCQALCHQPCHPYSRCSWPLHRTPTSHTGISWCWFSTYRGTSCSSPPWPTTPGPHGLQRNN